MLWRLMRRNPQRCLDLILAILPAVSDEDTLQHLSAGPLEDLLAENGAAVIDRIEQLADMNAAFASLLPWLLRNSMSDTIWQRIKALQKRGANDH